MRTISTICLDIETIAGEHMPTPDDIKAPAQYKKEESIQAFKNNPVNIDKEWRKQALIPTKGRIHTIAWKINSEPVKSIWHDGTDEENLMRLFQSELVAAYRDHYGTTETLYGTTLVGHNIKKFDAVWLWLRALKYGLNELLRIIGPEPRDMKLEDTMSWATLNNYREFVSLDAALQFFGLGEKGDIDGSMVHDMWLAGKHKEIASYCEDDTEKCHALACRLGIILPE